MAIHLSPRERQTVRLLSLGCTLPEVARVLRITPSTADNRKINAMERLSVDRAALLTRMAIKEGISPLNDKLSALEKRRSGRKSDGWNCPVAKRPGGEGTQRSSTYDGRRSNVRQEGGNRRQPGGEATVECGSRSEAIVSVQLTPREREVVRLVSLGCTIKEAARALKIPARNALYYKTRAMWKFGVDSVVLLTRFAIQEGVSPLDDRLTALEKRRSGRKNDGRKQPKAAARFVGGRLLRRLDARYEAEQGGGKPGLACGDERADLNVDCEPSFSGLNLASRLSPREQQVVRLLSLGCTVEEAARALRVSRCTADNQAFKAMVQLGVKGIALLTRVAIREGISPLNDKLTALEKRRSGRKNDGWN